MSHFFQVLPQRQLQLLTAATMEHLQGPFTKGIRTLPTMSLQEIEVQFNGLEINQNKIGQKTIYPDAVKGWGAA